MSSEKVPEDQRTIVLRVYLLNNMATVEACWDDAVGLAWLESAYGKQHIVGNEFEVYVIYPKGSEPIDEKTAKEIAIRWMKGSYVTVQLDAN